MKHLNVLLASLLLLSSMTVITFAQMPNTVDGYLHLTQIETCFWDESVPEDIVWFYDGDTLDGALRSNDYIAIKRRPVFLGPLFSSQDNFRENSANAHFEYAPEMGVLEFEFPFVMEEMQEIAEDQGFYYSGFFGNERVQSRLEAMENAWHLTQWPADEELSDSTILIFEDIAYDNGRVIYIDSDLEIQGNYVQSNMTIVCDGKVRITDNLMYVGTIIGNDIIIPETSTHVLGIIASGDIHIANTEANGRGNGLNEGPFSDHSNKHCVITACLVSIEGSFSYENKNFLPGMTRYDGYVYNNCESQDRRGTAYLVGSKAMYRRDYMANSNCGRTGYDKHFSYDQRLEELTPPLFDTPLSVGDGPRSSATLPITHRVEKVYPNPFNSSFNLNMTLIKRDQVRIRLINVLGQEIYNQNNGWMDKGDQRFVIDIAEKPAGLYFTEISTSSGFRQTSKVVFMK